MSASIVRTRYAPSPTGEPHVGNIRTALFAWLTARANNGSFVLRIEDTDQRRKVEGAVEMQMEALRWLGVDWDEGPDIGGAYGPYTQSQRLEHYRQAADQLVHAYNCYCPWSVSLRCENHSAKANARATTAAAATGLRRRPGPPLR